MRTGAVLLALGLTALGASGGRAAETAYPGRAGRIVFVTDRAGSTAELTIINPDGRGRRSITHHAPFAIDPTPSPDGSRVAFFVEDPFTSEGALWLAGADGGNARPLVRKTILPAYPRELSWSPDGRHIAYLDYRRQTDWDIWIVDTAGRRRRLTGTPQADSRAAWSPDGSEIAFVRAEGPDDVIWIVRVDGRGERRLVPGSPPSWSPDGREIAFQLGNPPTLGVAAADGSGVRLLGAGEEPAWSTDGARIAYVRQAASPCDSCRWSLEVMRRDGTGRHRILGPSVYAQHPAWSPDGKRIAFVSDGPDRGSVDVVGATGRGLRRVSPDARGLRSLFPDRRDRRRFLAAVQIGAPSWAQRGSTLLFSLQNGDFAYSVVYAANVATERGRSFLGSAPGVDLMPMWSPDGRRIAFTRDNYQLWVRAGTRERRVAEGWSPSWSPDGRRIVVENPVSCDRIVTVETGSSRGIHCDGAEFGTSPAWSPDGRWIAYIGSNPGGEIRLYSPRTGAIRGLRVFAESDLAWSPDARRLAYTAELRGCGRPLCRAVYLLDVAARRSKLLVDDGSEASWSPDGRALVFVRRGSLHVVGADGSRQRRLTYSGHDFSPNWQPLRPHGR